MTFEKWWSEYKYRPDAAALSANTLGSVAPALEGVARDAWEAAGAPLASFLDAMKRHHDLAEAEVKKLCERPEMFDVAQVLADAFFGNIKYLCNFPDGVPAKEMYDVMQRLEKDTVEAFARLTGREYVHPITRKRKK